MKIAIVGVMENIGREILAFLEEDGTDPKDVFAVENNMPLGNQVSYGEDAELDVHNLDSFDFSKAQLAVFSTTAEIAKRYIPKALKAGIRVIDCTGSSLSNPDSPMVVSGFNDDKLSKASLISIPSYNTYQLLLPLKEIDSKYHIKRIILSTYTSTSVYGKLAMDELFNQTRKIFMNTQLEDDKKVFNKQIAFNVIPQVGEFMSDETSDEWKINVEVKKIFNHDVKVHANCAVVASFVGNAQYINVECEKDIDIEDATQIIKNTKGVVVFNKNLEGGYVTLTDVQGENNVYVSRLRQDISCENGISFWSVADNLRVGIAKNAYQIINKIK
ncbi:MAG: aspartate-semialdehyde dehydrogenase [Lactobacillus sp.]|jgi:aspartate-semialdehyde dehydrogenase|nr:aspartate-semialdehyde dehydrogenase [Lactobacillus sp.]